MLAINTLDAIITKVNETTSHALSVQVKARNSVKLNPEIDLTHYELASKTLAVTIAVLTAGAQSLLSAAELYGEEDAINYIGHRILELAESVDRISRDVAVYTTQQKGLIKLILSDDSTPTDLTGDRADITLH
ncbi:hypothetical protein ABN214_14935 [Proteus terrae]|uniref:hypothetical protein n=1 Tax=Proteus terrae TaxID=1574161 RepID=UPI0032D9CE75